MRSRLTRRAWVRGLAAGAVCLAGCRRRERLWRWEGLAFGSEVHFLFEPPLVARAPEIASRCSLELRRLESIFSLQQEDSAVRRLNETGWLDTPPEELVQALDLARQLHERTDGAFDVTVQPLWEVYEDHFFRYPGAREGPDPGAVQAARERTGFGAVAFDAGQIRLGKPGMRLTLNAIAQGLATDRITGLLREAGVRCALVNLGEFRAVGSQPEGEAWRVAVRGAEGAILDVISLADRALAVSSGSGWMFDGGGRFSHVFDPREGVSRPAGGTLAVCAPCAGWADGLATAGLVMEPEGFARAVRQLPWPVEFRRYPRSREEADAGLPAEDQS